MKHSLQLKLSNQLALTPALQQSIRLLQLSTLELQQEIKQLIQDNPLLEVEDEEEDEPTNVNNSLESNEERLTNSEPSADTDWQRDGGSENYGKPQSENQSDDHHLSATREISLSDHLNEQLSLLKISEQNKQLVMYLIGNLDDNGFLKEDMTELVEALPKEIEITDQQMDEALTCLQGLGPVGVGARNLAECLELQINALPDDVPNKDIALQLVKERLHELATRDYNRLKKILNCDDETLREVQKLIQGLDPRPGSAFSLSETRYIIPDVYVKRHNSKWTAFLNQDAKPKLKINKIYADILKNNTGENFQKIKDQLTDAKWFIKNVEQRYDTILRVSQAIVDQQYNFFEHGDLGMRPLVLREIAERLDLAESTISRVTTQKYMMTPRGILELKYFFGSHVATQSGGSASSTAIKALIKKIVNQEDKRKPVSDSQISKLLDSQGIMVARRTVAKYREALQILPVNLRKDL